MLGSDLGDGFCERAGALFEGFKVAFLVVAFVVLPAAIEDALPFEGEAAQDGLVAVSFVFLLLVVGFGPEGF